MENTLKKLVKALLKDAEEESYTQVYGEGYKAGKIEAYEEVLKLIP